MFPDNIVIVSVLRGECKVDVDLIISHWHSGAKIIKCGGQYTLVEQMPGDMYGNAKMKVQISSEDACKIINALNLSAKEYAEYVI